jgi:hypothetical protein
VQYFRPADSPRPDKSAIVQKTQKLCLAEFSAVCNVAFAILLCIFANLLASVRAILLMFCVYVSKGMLISIFKNYYGISTQTRANASDSEMVSLATVRQIHLSIQILQFSITVSKVRSGKDQLGLHKILLDMLV